MATFQQLVEKNEKLKQKLRAFEHVKDFVEDGLNQFDPEIVQEVLLDLDEFCVAPLVDEIGKIEGARISRKPKTTEKRDGKATAKKERKPTKAAKKEGRKRKAR